MSLRIAFDLDGTVADLDSALAEITRRLFGDEPEAVTPDDRPAPGTVPRAALEAGDPAAAAPSLEEERVTPPRVRSLSARQQQMVWEAARRTEDFWETLEETEPGIVSRIAALARERRWEVIFLTQRPGAAGGTTQRQSQRWLAAHGFDLPSVFVISGSRGKIAAALGLDIVVDDRTENCLDVKVDSQARSVLVMRDDNPKIPGNAARLGIQAVRSVGELLDGLETTQEDPPPSFLRRLKRMMGS
ncbi:MAG TPA: hypothetical protein VK911_12245 [Vicinamibacterales bacterium]|nr:hypothetical protein [Vicinamibacterales bacterium]